MSNTPTPRTDNAEMPIDRVDTIASRQACVVHADFSRQLERELAEAKRLISRMVEVESQWDSQAVGGAIEGLQLGDPIRPAILPYIRKLQRELAEAENNNAMLKKCLLQMQEAAKQLADTRRERDNALSDFRQADTDSIRALHERNEAREERDNARKEAERFRNVIQDCKWPKHVFSWENKNQKP
jgi:DNA repair ATPase RecN